MWFIIAVKAYHAAAGAGNRKRFIDLARASTEPMGLIAYADGVPAGWCAAGPRSRYARAIRTPTYGRRDPTEDDKVWLVPCLYVAKDARGSAIGEELVRSAVQTARQHGAKAVEAFPLAGGKRQRADTQVGFEPVFERCGFLEINRPSANRVFMRLDLGG